MADVDSTALVAAGSAAYALGPAGAAAAIVAEAGKNIVSYAVNVADYMGKALAALVPVLGPKDAAYVAKYVGERGLTYFEKSQDDYCRKTGCEPKLLGFELWDPGYDKSAAGSSLAQSFYNLTTQKQYLGRPERDGWIVKAAVYAVYGNTKRVSEANAKAASLKGTTMATSLAEAKNNAGRPPSAAEEQAAQIAAEQPMLSAWPGRYQPPAIGVELSYGASQRTTPGGGYDFAKDGTWGRSWDEKAQHALFGLSKAKLMAVNAELKTSLLPFQGDPEAQKAEWYRLARVRLLEAQVPAGQIAAVYGPGPGLPAGTEVDENLPLTPSGGVVGTMRQVGAGRPWWHYALGGLVTVVVIGGVVYIVRK